MSLQLDLPSSSEEQLCHVCSTVVEIYGTNEHVVPWLCVCRLYEVKRKAIKQENLFCKCPVRKFASGRKITYCNC